MIDTQPTDRSGDTMNRAELWISIVLRVGVSVSLAVIVVGMLTTMFHHPAYVDSRSELAHLTSPGESSPRTLADVVDGLRQFKGQAIVTTGLLLLILTPVMRVAISIFAFIEDRDYPFVAITTTVFAILILSFLLGRIEM